MPRPRKDRTCREYSGSRIFKPIGVRTGDLERIQLRLDELEAMRHCDLEGLDQETAGARMGVSRGTVHRLLKSGRPKVLRALVHASALVIGEEEKDRPGDRGEDER